VTPRGKSALLWGAVGLLAFLVLVQGYQLLVGPTPVGFLGKLVVGVVVGVVAAGASYLTERRLARKGRT
jgi:1,4-dihydroxy-2-naphthoate octaprenyltransferase